MTLKDLLQKMWLDYSTLNPKARSIHSLLSSHGEAVLNDHVAYRTYQHPEIGLEKFEKLILGLGYQMKGTYEFKEKKLLARHYEPKNPEDPKIFVSELMTKSFSTGFQKTVEQLIAQVPNGYADSLEFLIAGRPWKIDHKTYETLAKESEYGAWMSAFGFRPNHFTVNVNALKKFTSLQDLNSFLVQNGHKLNSSGGLIKGTPEVFLEQSSTMAEQVTVDFTDGKFRIPACYYEFAKRYAGPDGKLYQGFIEKSADKIFESTNKS